MNIAFFDFDGTLTLTDTFSGFIRFALPARKVCMGTLRLGPLIAGYRLGVVRGPAIRQGLSRVAFRGMKESDIGSLGARYANEVIPRIIRPRALERMYWHKARGDQVVIVSASLEAYLASFCQRHGVELICSRLEVENGALTGRYSGADCAGQEKVRRILERYNLSEYPVVYAYGDTEEDRGMLALAHKKYFRGQELIESVAG